MIVAKKVNGEEGGGGGGTEKGMIQFPTVRNLTLASLYMSNPPPSPAPILGLSINHTTCMWSLAT